MLVRGERQGRPVAGGGGEGPGGLGMTGGAIPLRGSPGPGGTGMTGKGFVELVAMPVAPLSGGLA